MMKCSAGEFSSSSGKGEDVVGVVGSGSFTSSSATGVGVTCGCSDTVGELREANIKYTIHTLCSLGSRLLLLWG